MSQHLTTFDMAALLDSDEAISEYLSQVLADGDSEEFSPSDRLCRQGPRHGADR